MDPLQTLAPRYEYLFSQDRLASARVCQSDVFERFDEPFAVVAGQHRLNQSVHRMWSCWMPTVWSRWAEVLCLGVYAPSCLSGDSERCVWLPCASPKPNSAAPSREERTSRTARNCSVRKVLADGDLRTRWTTSISGGALSETAQALRAVRWSHPVWNLGCMVRVVALTKYQKKRDFEVTRNLRAQRTGKSPPRNWRLSCRSTRRAICTTIFGWSGVECCFRGRYRRDHPWIHP